MNDDGLEIRDLTLRRGPRTVLRQVSLTVPRGMVTALLGANGAGKSSLVLSVGGILPVAEGSMSIGARSVLGLRPEAVRAAGIAVVPEGRRILRELSVADNLRVATHLMRKSAAKEGVERALELFPELKARWRTTSGALSGGEQQMVALAQGVVSGPDFLFVDELSLGLAPIVVKRLAPVLTRVAASGVGILLIEQFAHVALGIAERAYVMESGRIRYDGPTSTLRDDPSILQSAYLAREDAVDDGALRQSGTAV